MAQNSCFTHFKSPIENIELPTVFTFPFYYDPHPIALQAAKELQHKIEKEIQWNHDFGLNDQSIPKVHAQKSELTLGKMFGVLVVKNKQGQLGYLSAFSGKLEEENLGNIFVPSIYNRFDDQDYFCIESEKLDKLSKQIDKLSADPKLIQAKENYQSKKKEFAEILHAERAIAKKKSKARKHVRNQVASEMDPNDYKILHDNHVQKSINEKFYYKAYEEHLSKKLAKHKSVFDNLNDEIIALKEERKAKSIKVQQWLFDQYNFLNSKGNSKNVVELFKGRIPDIPPSGAGDCAAPKLIQYAYQNEYELIALAEFWWGKAPNSKVRKHKNYYPACRGKCEPILNFMLEGINVSPNPLLNNPAFGKKLETIYEDEHLVFINKPAEFLSVPGKFITDSVQERMLKKYPNATGPLIVHRLDMSTSGLLVVAKSKDVHKVVQDYFKRKKIKKRYVALLDGIIKEDQGFIDLPLRLDIDNRPFQLVCYEYGKSCRTKFEVIERYKTTTKVYFYPITGRTHQLRVHAAHRDGLATPIVGDDLYGIKKDRLHLHAESIAFEHPITKKLLEVQVDAEF